MPVTRVTVHHEGAGTPTDEPRGAEGGYTYWIGVDRWTRLRPVSTSYATLGYNHVSVDICLSGNRMISDVDGDEIRMIGECVADARARGEVVDAPGTYPHKQSYLTACPGDQTMEVFGSIINVTQAHAAPPPPAVDWKRVQFLVDWRNGVERTPLHYGNRGPAVQVMNDLLVLNGYLKKSGNAYGIRSWAAVRALKDAHHWPKGPGRSGRNFAGKAADALLADEFK